LYANTFHLLLYQQVVVTLLWVETSLMFKLERFCARAVMWLIFLIMR